MISVLVCVYIEVYIVFVKVMLNAPVLTCSGMTFVALRLFTKRHTKRAWLESGLTYRSWSNDE